MLRLLELQWLLMDLPFYFLSFCVLKWKLHSRVRLFVTQARILEWGSLSLLQGIFPTQGLKPGLSHCSRFLYQLSHKGSPRILEWVAYPFSSRPSQLRNWTMVSCIAGGFFTNWAIREALSFSKKYLFIWLHWVLVVVWRLTCPMACGILTPWPGDWTHMSCTVRRMFNHWTTREIPLPFHFQQSPHSENTWYVCAQLLRSCPIIWDPMDCSPSGSSVHRILQARILEWAGDLPDPGIKPASLTSPALAWRFFTTAPPGKILRTQGSSTNTSCVFLQVPCIIPSDGCAILPIFFLSKSYWSFKTHSYATSPEKTNFHQSPLTSQHIVITFSSELP